MAKQKYRALVVIEWPDYENTDAAGRPTTVRIEAGQEFEDPPDHTNIAELVKHKAAEKVRG